MPTARPRRTFLGIGLDDTTRDLLAAHMAEHLPNGVSGKPVPPANWHVTLRFLGATTAVQLDRVAHGFDGAELPEKFSVRFGTLGAFPRAARAAVLWLGIARGDELLSELASVAEEAAVGAGLGAEERPFHPHVTLARVRPPIDVRPALASVPAFSVDMDVAEITLFQSHLGRGGARYEALERFSL